ncbi:hypothetical protein GN956_G25709 [Arapaima gigas]
MLAYAQPGQAGRHEGEKATCQQQQTGPTSRCQEEFKSPPHILDGCRAPGLPSPSGRPGEDEAKQQERQQCQQGGQQGRTPPAQVANTCQADRPRPWRGRHQVYTAQSKWLMFPL